MEMENENEEIWKHFGSLGEAARKGVGHFEKGEEWELGVLGLW